MPGGGMPTQQQVQEQQAKAQQAEEMRKELITKTMVPDAQERLARLALVKPEKVRARSPREAMKVATRVRPRAQVAASNGPARAHDADVAS